MNAVLLRLLLIVSLVLNGPGIAMASSMAMMPSMTAHADAAADATPVHDAAGNGPMRDMASSDDMRHLSVANARPPCHGDDTGSAAADLRHASPADAGTHRGTPAHPTPDCCQGSSCQCTCAHVASFVFAAFRLQATVGTAAVPAPPESAHAEPGLPHLIRPPIG